MIQVIPFGDREPFRFSVEPFILSGAMGSWQWGHGEARGLTHNAGVVSLNPASVTRKYHW